MISASAKSLITQLVEAHAARLRDELSTCQSLLDPASRNARKGAAAKRAAIAKGADLMRKGSKQATPKKAGKKKGTRSRRSPYTAEHPHWMQRPENRARVMLMARKRAAKRKAQE